MDWTQFAIFFIGVFGLFIWNRTESRNDIRAMTALIDAIREDMKDFHGKLERQDAEYRGIMAVQDAEFKAHMMHLHDKK